MHIDLSVGWRGRSGVGDQSIVRSAAALWDAQVEMRACRFRGEPWLPSRMLGVVERVEPSLGAH